MAQFERIYQSVRTVAVGGRIEMMVDERSEFVYAPRPRPLADVLAVVDADPELHIDLYYDYVLPLRAV